MVNHEINLDYQREVRIGFSEAIYCETKSQAQLTSILHHAQEQGVSLLLTRLCCDQIEQLPEDLRQDCDYDPISKTGFFNKKTQVNTSLKVALVSAGSSDIQVCQEVVRTLSFHGESCFTVYDAGVAGIWRLLDRVEEIKRYSIIIVVAGMDAALPSVVGGLVPGLVIAVPTSIGYGAAENGKTALNSMLTSCAPGIVVCNIDNGYGAACAALRVLRANGKSKLEI